MNLGQLLLANLAVITALFTSAWMLSLIRRDAGIADLFWGLGFVAIAGVSLGFGTETHPRQLILALCVSIWGLRLSGYLAWRNLCKPEDYRYATMRKKHGDHFAWRSLFMVFWLQGLLMWVISFPIQVGGFRGEGWPPTILPGTGLWMVGIVFESVGDFQLARFKSNPANKGKVMRSGLWRYTRHPNYFGDFLVWWGLFLLAVEPQSWWWTILGPVLMSFLLIRVSGVHLLETSLRTRLDDYEEYVRTTSAFFPLPPRSCERTVRGEIKNH
ncbi:MAG: DUF1295 domain-containing protein [Pirellulales bacterium]|nr:DUF1295 domain-containing protein [Pirellulales bacterium]